MRIDRKKRYKIGIILSIILIIIGYSAFQARKILEGPVINISSPLNGQTIVDNSLVDIVGQVKNVQEIKLNSRNIYMDEKGNFKEKLLLYDGYNIIKIEARDKFGKTESKNLYLIFRKSL